MSFFQRLKSESPNLAEQLVAACGGDETNAEQLANEIHEDQVQAERKRCLAHVELARLAGDLFLALPGVESGEPADKWGDYYLEHAGAGRELGKPGEQAFNTLGRPLAVALVNAALTRKDVSNAN